MNKSWKADLEFEALYESAYKQKVDSRNLHPLQRKGIKSGSDVESFIVAFCPHSNTHNTS